MIDEKTLRKVFEHAEAVDKYCEKIGAIRVMTALFGSQNYGLSTPESDVDTKSIIVPRLDDWLWSTEGNTNHVIEMPDGSHAELKPIVGMFKQFIKGNINFLEMLYTPYVDIAEGWEWLYNELAENADNICRHNMYKQTSVWFGYINQMITRTLRSSKTAKVNPDTNKDEQGYDYSLNYNPKAAMNAMRLKETFIRYFEFQRPFDEAIDMSSFRTELLSVKKGNLSREFVVEIMNNINTWIDKTHAWVENHYVDKEVWDVETFFRELCLKIFHAKE